MTEPEYHHHEEFVNRSIKLKEIQEMGIDPYPPKYTPSTTFSALNAKFEGKELGHSEEAAEGKTEQVNVAGRLILFRAMGKNAFAHLQDETGRIQVMFNRDLTEIGGFQPTAELSAIKFLEKKNRSRRFYRRRRPCFSHSKG